MAARRVKMELIEVVGGSGSAEAAGAAVVFGRGLDCGDVGDEASNRSSLRDGAS